MQASTTSPQDQSHNYIDGGTHISTTTFMGGSHAFGNNSTINNLSGYARLYEIRGNAVINHLTDVDELKKIQAIVNLPRAQAGRRDYEIRKKIAPCFPGTREALLREMMDWVTDPEQYKMYVLSGLAGIGKSTVLYTIATQAEKRGLLSASFFFSRDEADRRSADKFFTTLAYQLCLFNEAFAQAIARALITECGSAATTGNPQEQLEALILDPLRVIVTPNTPQTLIVVDALDECAEDAHSVLMGLRQIVQALPSFQVILSTRPQRLLDYDFATYGGYNIFRLHDIEDKVVNEDIQLYLKRSLSHEQVRAQLQDHTMEWCASDSQVESLVHAAGKLFIIASTAVRYILDTYWSDPANRIKTLLDAFAQDRTPFENLSNFYTFILRSAVPAGCIDKDLVERYQAIVSTIVLAQVPLSVHTLASVIGIDAGQVSKVLRQLQSIIVVGADNIPRIFHKSFPDYIMDSHRCQDVNLRIVPESRQTQITIHCFQIMEQHLKYNILDLGEPARYLSNKDGLAHDGITDEQLQKKIPQHVRYVCVYWANHLRAADVDTADLIQELEKFGNHRMLPWFEVLSLIGKLDLAHRAIHAASVPKVSKLISSELRQLISDGQRFLAKFYEVIERSALHTYYTALVFTPTDSMLYRRYTIGNIDDTCNVIVGPEKWDSLVANLSHGKQVDNIQFSLDSTMFASWSVEQSSGQGLLMIWDTTTGTPIAHINGGRFAIANDFSTVASAKNNTVTLYNVNGSERGATFTAQTTILHVEISSDGGRIAAGLSDRFGSLCLWDSRQGKLVKSFDDGYFENKYYPLGWLQFSATGTRFAYSSSDYGSVVKLRDGINGRLIANLNCGSRQYTVAFSHDGSRIALVNELVVILWSCEDGKFVGIADAKNDYKLAISTNGSFLATGNHHGAVKLWSGNSNALQLIEVLDLDLRSMTFSPDDTLAISTYPHNIKLYNIKTRSFTSSLLFRGATALAFSPDYSRFAAGDWDGILHLWDARDVEVPSPSKRQETGPVTALALSRDCSHLACGFSEDGTIELWETDGLAKQPISVHRIFNGVKALGFSTDGSQLASGLTDGTVKLLDGKNMALLRSLEHHSMDEIYSVEFSDSMLAVLCDKSIVLWDCKTLDYIHTFQGCFRGYLTFSANGALLAAKEVQYSDTIVVLDVTKRTTIATFNYPNKWIDMMGFLSNDSTLAVVRFDDKDFRTFNVGDKVISKLSTFEHIGIHLPSLPLWRGIPVWVSWSEGGQPFLRALFEYDYPVPVLWILREFGMQRTAEGRSMIAFGCQDGRVLLLRLPTSSCVTPSLQLFASCHTD